MPLLADYTEFNGRHYETGSIRNVLAYHGVVAPHTGQPPSEALLLGLSGGIVFGYFLFDYGQPARLLSLLSRNTFDPIETLLDRLAVPRDVRRTADPGRAESILEATLEAGDPAIVWADLVLLPYSGLPRDDGWWVVTPIVVYGLENGTARVADRSSQPFRVDRSDLAAARGRIAKDRHRQMTLGAPDFERLPDAVRDGIRQSVALFFDKPPKGARTNFGLEGLRHWAAMLTNTRNPRGWARFFPAGPDLWSALAGHGFNPGLVGWIGTWGLGDGMERGVYADFLDEAADILGNPELRVAAEGFRASRKAWLELMVAATPDDVPVLREARELALRRRALFVERGDAALDEVREIDARRRELAGAAAREFPLDDVGLAAMREEMSALVLRIADLEGEAFGVLREAVG
jgi:Butirosin biosynthesis protein H, N-terminal/Domain of unknown function (DUF4872)